MLITLILAVALPGGPSGLPLSSIEVQDRLSADDDLENSCSLGCAVGWHVRASSASKRHPASHLDDSRIGTAWVAAPEDASPELVFSFPLEVFGDRKSVRFDGFLVCGGFAGSRALWQRHARPRNVVVSVNGNPVARAELHDVRRNQVIKFDDVQLKPSDLVSVRIIDVYPGAARRPVAIAALVPQGAH